MLRSCWYDQGRLLILGLLCFCLGLGCKPAPEATVKEGAKPSEKPAGTSPPSEAQGQDLFVDVTQKAGIDFTHVSGQSGGYYLIETFGGGAAWFDYDGDGFLDLYVVNGHEDPLNGIKPGEAQNRLYHNEGDGTFREVSLAAGVDDRHYGQGACAGDFDNDGDPDLYVTNYGPNVFYRNNGDGTFSDISVETGTDCHLWSSSAMFVDINQDGLLDLYVGSYLLYDTRTAKTCKGGGKVGYCHPREFAGTPDRLYLNKGGEVFEEIGKEAGVALASRESGKALGVIATDYDGDGDQDIYVANDETPNSLFQNLGGNRFKDVALELGVALDRNGKTEAGMGIDVGDINGDGLFDIHVTNYAYETNALYVQMPGHFFNNNDAVSRLAAHTYIPLSFGVAMIDFDLDGDLDIYTSCGHIMDDAGASEGMGPRQPDLLFQNRGDGTFDNISARAGAWFKEKLIARGAAFGDYDNDGDMDAFIVNKGARGVLLENRSPRGHFVRLHLKGTQSNRDAYGAHVTAHFGGKKRVFEVRSCRSYVCANDPRLIIGFKGPQGPDRITIRWPSGIRQELTSIPVDRTMNVVEPAGPGKQTQ